MTPQYNLVLYHVPTRQCISDFMVIRNMMVGRAPDIQVHILTAAGAIPPEFWKKVGERPTLIFSPSYLAKIDTPIRGARLMSTSASKLEELELIASSGARVPETRIITPDLRLDEADWGSFTVVKPNRGMQGRGVSLMRTRSVRWTDTTILPKEDPRHGVDLLAQRYVDTGPFVTCYRVFTVLGRPIYCIASTSTEKRSAPDIADNATLDLAVAANSMPRKIELSYDQEVIDLAKSIHAQAVHLPVMGLDIIREHGTGRLFGLEYNSGGGVWHLSSGYGLRAQYTHKLDLYRQFNALDTITDALIEKTRDLAV